jgi:DNA-binding NtrC family response regulator
METLRWKLARTRSSRNRFPFAIASAQIHHVVVKDAKGVAMPAAPSSASELPNFVGKSEPFMRALTMIERMARYDAPVLIQGETGTGKELAARAVHYLSSRRQAPFVALNCGAVPETLIETELFGYERGAFTDARQATSGLVAAAEGGTLFLDELDALPQRAQVALLRFLQDKTYRSVGGRQERFSNVRIIAAASPRLHEMLDNGSFRDDLAFRINVLLLEMPPLRERDGDAQLLAVHFVERHARHYGIDPRPLAEDSQQWLSDYRWPGNVRELDNVVQRALLLSDAAALDLRPYAGITFAPSRSAQISGWARQKQTNAIESNAVEPGGLYRNDAGEHQSAQNESKPRHLGESTTEAWNSAARVAEPDGVYTHDSQAETSKSHYSNSRRVIHNQADANRSEPSRSEPNRSEPNHSEPNRSEQIRSASSASVPRYNDARACAISNFEQDYLRRLMAAAAGNVTRAAGMAGKERRTLGRLLKKYGI